MINCGRKSFSNWQLLVILISLLSLIFFTWIRIENNSLCHNIPRRGKLTAVWWKQLKMSWPSMRAVRLWHNLPQSCQFVLYLKQNGKTLKFCYFVRYGLTLMKCHYFLFLTFCSIYSMQCHGTSWYACVVCFLLGVKGSQYWLGQWGFCWIFLSFLCCVGIMSTFWSRLFSIHACYIVYVLCYFQIPALVWLKSLTEPIGAYEFAP